MDPEIQSKKYVEVFKDLLTAATADLEPVQQLDRLLQKTVAITGATCGRLYALRLSSFSYVLLSQSNHTDALPSFSAEVINNPELVAQSIVHRALIQSQPIRPGALTTEQARFLCSSTAKSRMLTQVRRSKPCLGLIDLESDQNDHFTPTHQLLVEAAAAVCLILFEKDDNLALFQTLPKPVDFRQGSEGFTEELMLLTAEASRMPFIALRELEDNGSSLKCIACWGFSEVPKSELDLTPLSEYESFRKAVSDGAPVVEKSMSAPGLAKLKKNPHLEKVKSFVAIPVKLGAKTFGTLSFAAPCEYDYTDLEIRGFETISNAIGVSISNWRNFRAAEANVFNEAKTSVAIGITEVAQSARHEVKNFLQVAQTRLKHIHDLTKESSRSDLRAICEDSEAVSQQLQKALAAIEKIKAATKPPKRELAVVDIAALWTEAFDTVGGRIASNQITYSIKGKAQTVGYPEFLRHAFLHFLYNSIEAFIERGIKRGRHISVQIDLQGKSANNLSVRYTDTAGGIDPSSLRPPLPPGQKLNNYIFEKEVTSKPDGSGYGLFLVRRIIQNYHKGSVELIDYRGGVVFEIELPKVENLSSKSSNDRKVP